MNEGEEVSLVFKSHNAPRIDSQEADKLSCAALIHTKFSDFARLALSMSKSIGTNAFSFARMKPRVSNYFPRCLIAIQSLLPKKEQTIMRQAWLISNGT